MDWLDYDLEKKIKDFEYTIKASVDIGNIVNSEEYEEQDSEMIYEYLYNQTKEISFKDYLKRYIYYMAEFEEEFLEIPDEEYIEIIKMSFEDRNAPYYFQPTTRKKGKIIKDFIQSDRVKRETVFVLGFGLGMSDEDVCEFLTKVNLDHSIDFKDYKEVIYWFCYRYECTYAYAKRIQALYESLEPDESLSEETWGDLYRSPKFYITSEEELIFYLKHLRTFGEGTKGNDILFQEFEEIYQRALQAISNDFNKRMDSEKEIKPGNIGLADIEKMLCSGIPVSSNGNYQKMSSSTLARKFMNKKMGRQRIESVLHGKHPVERFDLISLLFLIYALEVEPDWPAERYYKYVEEINAVLSRCDMEGIYPVNPYEAFILMCLLTDYPLLTYSEVFEKSFDF